MDKQVLATLVRSDKAIALCAVEPAGGGWPLGRAQPSRSSKALAQEQATKHGPDSCAGGKNNCTKSALGHTGPQDTFGCLLAQILTT